jgi:IclR family transcriptional regulator, KDG regulon repressor
MNDKGVDVAGAGVKSALRTLDVLELLAARPEGLTLSRICRELGCPKSSAHALLATLGNRGYVRASVGGGAPVYVLGHRVFELGSAYIGSVDLVRDGQEVVRLLSAECDETVHLAGLDGRSVLYLAKDEGTKTMRMVSAVGRRFPAYGTGVGKVLLAGLDDAELASLFPDGVPLDPLTPNTITDPVRFREVLELVRRRGYAVDDGESTLGLSCLALPIYDSSHLVAAISVSVPSVRFPPERGRELLELARRSAREISLRLGAGDYPDSIRAGTTRQV